MPKQHLSSVEIEGSLRLPPGVSVTLTDVITHDWAPAGLDKASALRVTCDSPEGICVITGLAGAADDQMLFLVNAGTENVISLQYDHPESLSAEANRFLLPWDTSSDPPSPGNVNLGPSDGVVMWYDSASLRWRVLFKQVPWFAEKKARYLLTTDEDIDTDVMPNVTLVGETPGGELGGTWAAPTVDPTHSGSSHAEIQGITEDNVMEALADGLVGVARKWVSPDFGTGGDTTFTITHNLNATQLAVTLWKHAADDTIVALTNDDVQILDANNINLFLTFMPAGNECYLVIVY